MLRQERDEVKKGPDEGIYIYGLYLDCAKWDKEKNRLADSDPKVCGLLYMPVSLSAPYPMRHIDIHKHEAHHSRTIYPQHCTQVLFAPLPVLWITGTLASASNGDKNVYYTCPTYKAPRRTGLNYITAVDLRKDDSASKWTLRGVALLTTTE